MTMIDFIRYWLAAKALDLAIVLMPPGPEAMLARRYISNACSTMIGALGGDDD